MGGGDGLLIGEVSKRSGASRKALRLYEEAGILPPPRRTASGYRVYGPDALTVLAFVRQAQRLGLTLEEIGRIVTIRRNGRPPCDHVRGLVRRKADELDRKLADLGQIRSELRAMLNGWRSAAECDVAICPQIENSPTRRRGGRNG